MFIDSNNIYGLVFQRIASLYVTILSLQHAIMSSKVKNMKYKLAIVRMLYFFSSQLDLITDNCELYLTILRKEVRIA